MPWFFVGWLLAVYWLVFEVVACFVNCFVGWLFLCLGSLLVDYLLFADWFYALKLLQVLLVVLLVSWLLCLGSLFVD